jgi:hypothetical protein
LQKQARLVVVNGNRSGERMLEKVGNVFADAVGRGARLIRVLGKIGSSPPRRGTDGTSIAV